MQTQDQPKPLVNDIQEAEVTIEPQAEPLIEPEIQPQETKRAKVIYSIFFKLLLVFIAVNLGIEFFRLVGSAFRCEFSKLYMIQSKSYVGSMNRAQQAFHIENNQFSNAVEPLGLEIPLQTSRFNYSTRTVGNAAFSYAIPREDIYETASLGLFSWKRKVNNTFKTYVGGVFVIPQSTSDNSEVQTVQIMCESSGTATTNISEPYLENNIPMCGEGTLEL